MQITGSFTFSESDKLMIVQACRDLASTFNKLTNDETLPDRLRDQFRHQANEINDAATAIESSDCLSTHRAPNE